MMKNLKQKLRVMVVAFAVLTFISPIAFGATLYNSGNINIVTNTERLQLYYDGYVQCRGSYVDYNWDSSIPYYMAAGYIRYTGGASGDTDRMYTDMATSKNDTKIQKLSHTYRDTFNPVAPKTKFYYGFTAVSKANADAGLWPYSITIDTESLSADSRILYLEKQVELN